MLTGGIFRLLCRYNRRFSRVGRITYLITLLVFCIMVNPMLNPNYKNFGLFPIASAVAACADLDARLPLPVNQDQTRLYREAFDDLGANGTVALRSLTSLIDLESGEALSYNELDDPRQYIGMASAASGKTKWNYQSKNEMVYAVCERILCQLLEGKTDRKTHFLLKITKH